jgi:hypothetical protein
MNEQAQQDAATCETLARIEEHVHCRLTGLLCDFQLDSRDKGLVLRGRVHTYYAKQLAQHAVMEACSLPIRANEMEAYWPERSLVSRLHAMVSATATVGIARAVKL